MFDKKQISKNFICKLINKMRQKGQNIPSFRIVVDWKFGFKMHYDAFSNVVNLFLDPTKESIL